MQTEIPASVPEVEDHELAAVASLFPELPNLRAELADRFAQAVRGLVETRAQNGWPSEGDSTEAVFLMVDHPRQIGEIFGATPFTDLRAKHEPIFGRLFFTNRDASAGRQMPMPTSSNEILEWLDDRDLGKIPIVTVYRNTMQMLTRRKGTNDSARSDRIRDEEPSATVEELQQALEHFHVTCLLTPTCCPDGVWKPEHAHQYIPGPRPEKSIQSDLTVALNFWFRGIVKAEYEDTTNIGRIDIRLLKKTNGESLLGYWAILELKVIRSYASTHTSSKPSVVAPKSNVDAIIKGVRQARAYQTNRETDIGLLEIYDLRREKALQVLEHLDVLSVIHEATPKPEIHLWEVFGSSEDARNAGYSGI